VCWYADQYHKAIPYIPELIGPLIEQVRPHGPISIQWNIQPFEMFGLASVPDMVMHAMAHPKRYRAICDQIRDVNIEMIQEVFRCGADFVFLGSPGSEMMSPRLYEEFIVPDSWAISRSVHEAGGLVYCHICSPIEPFLSMGCFNHMGIDLFETLSPPPVGDVEDLARARQVLARQICTRGNVGLDVLLKGTAADVERATIAVLEATAGYKHMVAASDYLFYDVPLENVKTVVNTVKGYS